MGGTHPALMGGWCTLWHAFTLPPMATPQTPMSMWGVLLCGTPSSNHCPSTHTHTHCLSVALGWTAPQHVATPHHHHHHGWLFCVVGGVCCLCHCWCLFPCCVLLLPKHVGTWCCGGCCGGQTAGVVCGMRVCFGHKVVHNMCVPMLVTPSMACLVCVCHHAHHVHVCVVVPCHPHMLTTLQPYNRVWPMGCVVVVGCCGGTTSVCWPCLCGGIGMGCGGG